MSLSTFSYYSCGLPSSVLDVGESTTSSAQAYRSRRPEVFFVMCLLACVAVASFRFLASSQAGQARKARNLCLAPAYTSKAREKRSGEDVAAYAKNAHGFASPPACVASFSDEKEEYFHFLPIVGHVTAIFYVLPMDHHASSGRKNVLCKPLRIPYRRLKAGFSCVDCVCLLLEF